MAHPRLPIAPHLSRDEITRRSRDGRSGVETTHRRVLGLLTRPESQPAPARVAEPVGLTAGRVRAPLKRWNAEGPDGLADRCAAANGGQAELAPPQAELLQALRQPPPDGGLWTGPKVAADVRGRWGVAVGKQTGR